METSLSAVRRETRRFRLWMGALTALLLVLVVGALGLGRYGISPHDTVTLLLEPLGFDAELEGKRRVVENLLFQVRLPRIALAILAGAGLSAAGAAFQALFANPLASPATLGVATGASFGAVLGILFGATGLGIQFCALASGLLSVFLVLAIARVRGESGLLMMILAGMVVAALFTALISLVKYVADPQDVLPQITFWLMGALSGATVDRVLAGAPLILLALVALELFAWRLNVTTLTPDEAKSLGIPLARLRAGVITAATLLTASVVSLCGLIGWVGLLVPHAARLLFGSDNRYVLPASMILGALFMLVVDTLARTVSEAEIPVSILTAVIGAPFFILLLRRTQGGVR